MVKYWMGVACREHVMRGISEGICQVCHGKAGPLKQMSSDDWIVYYSPTEQFGKGASCRRFTAIGKICQGEPYPFEMSPDFIPWRRDVNFYGADEVPIEPLIEQLSFILDKQRWGFPFRRGCFSIPKNDFIIIATHMGIKEI